MEYWNNIFCSKIIKNKVGPTATRYSIKNYFCQNVSGLKKKYDFSTDIFFFKQLPLCKIYLFYKLFVRELKEKSYTNRIFLSVLFQLLVHLQGVYVTEKCLTKMKFLMITAVTTSFLNVLIYKRVFKYFNKCLFR